MSCFLVASLAWSTLDRGAGLSAQSPLRHVGPRGMVSMSGAVASSPRASAVQAEAIDGERAIILSITERARRVQF